MIEPASNDARRPALVDTGRITIPAVDDMTADQRKIYEATLAYLGGPYGPRIALLNRPAIAVKWSELLTALEASGLDKRLWSLTILIVARRWDSQFEWWAHASRAEIAGLPARLIEALRLGLDPVFEADDEAALYGYFVELFDTHKISDTAYDRARALVGSDALVDLTVLAGHYTSVAMTLAAHRMPLPPGAEALLPSLRD